MQTAVENMEPQVRPARCRVRRAAAFCLLPLVRRASRAYIAGDTLDDALRVADQLASTGTASTLGFWNADEDPTRHVTDVYLAAIRSLAARPGAYLSIKAPAIGFSPELTDEIAQQAKHQDVRLHFDAMAPDTVDSTRVLIERFLAAGVKVGTTLPGRWRRSPDDALWVAERGIPVRVVKGQWIDPSAPTLDLRTGFLEVINRLAGRASRVSVATHDVVLAEKAIHRLRIAGTACDLELLHGLPMKESLRLAARLSVDVRVYVPYGKAYLPYALSRMSTNPRLLWWLIRDALAWKSPVAAIAK
jgi:proline dehydrogenase